MLLIYSKNDKRFRIKRKTKKEKIDKEDGLIVTWLCYFWHENESRFLPSKEGTKFFKNQAILKIKELTEEYKTLRGLIKISKFNDFYYEGFEGNEKVVEWMLEEVN